MGGRIAHGQISTAFAPPPTRRSDAAGAARCRAAKTPAIARQAARASRGATPSSRSPPERPTAGKSSPATVEAHRVASARAASSRSARRSRSTSLVNSKSSVPAWAPSSTRKRGSIPASTACDRSSEAQNAWIVLIRAESRSRIRSANNRPGSRDILASGGGRLRGCGRAFRGPPAR